MGGARNEPINSFSKVGEGSTNRSFHKVRKCEGTTGKSYRVILMLALPRDSRLSELSCPVWSHPEKA